MIYLRVKPYIKKCYCFVKSIEENRRVTSTSKRKRMVLLKCAVFDSKNSRLIKEQETKKLLSNLGLKTPLSKVSLVGDILF